MPQSPGGSELLSCGRRPCCTSSREAEKRPKMSLGLGFAPSGPVSSVLIGAVETLWGLRRFLFIMLQGIFLRRLGVPHSFLEADKGALVQKSMLGFKEHVPRAKGFPEVPGIFVVASGRECEE